MKKLWMVMMAAWLVSTTGAMADVRLGLGVNYWQTIDDINLDDFDEDGLSWIASVQFGLNDWTRLELGVERFEKGFGGSPKDVYAPQAYFILGSGFYAAAGIGGFYTDGEWGSDPFYAFRVGVDFELLPNVHVDIYGNYRFTKWSDLRDDDREIDTDTVILGAAVRLGF